MWVHGACVQWRVQRMERALVRKAAKVRTYLEHLAGEHG
jgi:hypothetical protein